MSEEGIAVMFHSNESLASGAGCLEVNMEVLTGLLDFLPHKPSGSWVRSEGDQTGQELSLPEGGGECVWSV